MHGWLFVPEDVMRMVEHQEARSPADDRASCIVRTRNSDARARPHVDRETQPVVPDCTDTLCNPERDVNALCSFDTCETGRVSR